MTEVGTQTQGPQSVPGTFLHCPGEGWNRSGGASGELRPQGPGEKQWKKAVHQKEGELLILQTQSKQRKTELPGGVWNPGKGIMLSQEQGHYPGPVLHFKNLG